MSLEKIQSFKEFLEDTLQEGYKKLKSPIKLGSGKNGTYFLDKLGYDSNGNWSYMVSKGANKAKKIQHEAQWGDKLTKDTTEDNVNKNTSSEIIKYYEEFLK